MNHKHVALLAQTNYKLYILCTLYVSNPLHLTIGSILVFPQNEFCILKCCHVNFELFFLMFRITKGCHQNFGLLCTMILIIHKICQ